MKVLLLFVLGVLALGELTESGRILRTWRRRPGRSSSHITRHHPQLLKRFAHHPYPWDFFRQQRRIHAQTQIQPIRRRYKDEKHHSHRLDKPRDGGFWHHGLPIQRDPTTHYAPPSQDEISLGASPDRRSAGSHFRKFRPWRRPPPSERHISLWKLLAMKQRRRFRPWRPFPLPNSWRPYPPPYSEEAEITPLLPNILYFLPKDTLPKIIKPPNLSPTPNSTPAEDLKPGFVSDVPLYPTDVTAASEFKPVTVSSKEYLLKVVDVRKPSVLLKSPMTTPTTPSTQRSAPAPEKMDSTETLLHELLREPPSPINSFNINIDPNAEGSDRFINVVPSSFVSTEMLTSTTDGTPVTKGTTTTNPTPTTNTITTTTTTEPSTTTTFKPMFAVRVIMPSASVLEAEVEEPQNEEKTKKVESKEKSEKERKRWEGVEKDIAVLFPGVVDNFEKVGDIVEQKGIENRTLRPAPAYKWPTMKPYVKSTNTKKPIHSTSSKVSAVKNSGSISSSSSESTSISITGVRSRVKEYKPSLLATAPGLLAFDKVAETETQMQKESSSSTSTTSNPQEQEETTHTPSTTLSPMQNFDPMKMIHSWLTKAKS